MALASLKADFPILTQTIHGKPLVYLDNAATSQKPQAVLDAITKYYSTSNANVHRGVHALSDASTLAYEEAHKTIAAFFGAQPEELILVRNTTEATNGVAYGWGEHELGPDDVILTTVMEHHSSFVVWQQLALRTGAELRVVEVDEAGRLDWEDLGKQINGLGDRLKFCGLVHVSNTLGVENDIVTLLERVRAEHQNVKVYLDAAQSAPHQQLDFAKLDVDFLAFSGHKMLGPMGIGGLLVRRTLLERGEMRPWLFGGGMIGEVHLSETTFHDEITDRFIAGTPDVASAVGLAAACNYLDKIGMQQVEEHDRELVAYALEKLSHISEVTIIGPQQPLPETKKLDRLGSVAFLYQGVHAHDVAQILDSQGIAVRSGHHCTMPLHTRFSWPATVRASFQVYTTKDDIDQLIIGLEKVKQVFTA